MKFRLLATISLAFALGLSSAAWAGLATDTDSDGVPDASDNCINVANPAQCDNGHTANVGNACDMDANGDGTVSGADVPFFGAAFGKASNPFDANCDGTVSGADVPFFGARFGKAPGPSCCN